MLDREKAINQVKKWAKQAGEIQLGKMKSSLEVDTKSEVIDLVTEIDRLSEEILIRNIKRDYPDHSILAQKPVLWS